MADPLQLLLEEPDLLDEIAKYDVQAEFSPNTVKRAMSYLAPGIITRFSSRTEDDGVISFSAKVAGSRKTPYSTSVDFFIGDDGEWEVDYFCNCPVGFYCKHSAALMMWLKEALKADAGNNSQRIPKAVNDWLRVLETAETPKASQPGKTAPAQEKFLAYCLENASQAGGKIRFTLHPATRLKNGMVKIDPAVARADVTNPPKYIADEDLRICAAFRRHPTSYDGWSSCVFPEGAEGARLIEMALATGRFYYIAEQDFYLPSENHLQITEGEPVRVELAWDVLPSGNARPVIRGLNNEFRVLEVNPTMYLDALHGVIGPLVSDGPLHLLKHWEKGPEVDASIADLVSARLGSIQGGMVPAPVVIPSEVRPDCPPMPHFTVNRVSASLAGMPQDFIIGHLSFRYGDSEALPHQLQGGVSSEHIEIINGTRVIWKRDARLESELAVKLAGAGLLPFADLISEHLLHHSLRSAFVPIDPQPSSSLAWLRCLECQEMQHLREEGWIITVDPRAGLTAHDVGDFLPTIEAETDHGIDWFRFDVSFEVDGVKRSLIPLIAQAIEKNFPPSTTPDLPEWITIPCENPEDGFIRLPARRFLEIVDQVRHLFHGREMGAGSLKLDRLAAAGLANSLGLNTSATSRALAELGRALKDINELPHEDVPGTVKATLRPYQHEGFRWLRFLAKHHLNGILADDMGLGKTLQTLTHLAAEHAAKPGKPSLVVAPTSVVPNWAAEAEKFTPGLKVLTLHGAERLSAFKEIPGADLVITSYPLLHRDFSLLVNQQWHSLILDEAQHIKNPKSITAMSACGLAAAHRICLSGTPMENHLGELWSLMRFLMPGFLPDEKTFNSAIRKPIERDRSGDAQLALNRRVSPLILRRTKDQVATDLPPKTELIHHIELTKKQIDLYESVRAAMDKRVREAIAAKGLAKSHIIVLDALLKLRQICCHPKLLKTPAAEKVTESAKLHFLTDELLPQLLEEGRRILLFSQFTSMLALIETHLEKHGIPFLKLTGQTKDRASLVKQFQTGEVPVFLISLKAGGTGLNLTAADTVIHYDPWWNPAAENQATDRAHRIGQNKPVFVHKLVCRGSIEDRILDLQKHKSALVKALLSEETTSLRIDPETLSRLLEPIA
ncbi:MAG: DEAD/DEAH box helicase [Verrucomicrobiaceae bacterium]|nr:MAG: DEAD/DEAH box helicase [Verrucomicrobiaceae bacterium]